jgi:hypothetical protein
MSSSNFFELIFASIYDLNTNVNSGLLNTRTIGTYDMILKMVKTMLNALLAPCAVNGHKYFVTLNFTISYKTTLNTNVDFSDFIFVKIYSKFDVRKHKLSLNHKKIKATENHANINK